MMSDLERVERSLADDEHGHPEFGGIARAELVRDPRHTTDMSGSGALRGRTLSHHHDEKIECR